MSCFAAFGATAPSFFDEAGTALPIIRPSKKAKSEYGEKVLIHKRTNANGELTLPQGKIPVFIKATALAIGDFKTMKKSFCISYRISNKGGIANAAYLVDKGHADQIANLLIECFSPPKVASRKRDREMVEDLSALELTERADRATKKAKKTSAGQDLWGQVVL